MYRANSDIRACVRELQNTAGKSGYKFRKWIDSQSYYKDVSAPDVEKILSYGKGFDYLKNQIVKHITISENVFIEKLYRLGSMNIVVGLRVLDPRYMSIISDTNYNPIRYIYQDRKTNQTIRFEPKDIIHFMREQDHDNPMFGLSSLEGLVSDVFGDDKASIYNAMYFENDATPAMIYFVDKSVTEQSEIDVIEQYIKDKFRGSENKHKAIISPSIEDVKTIDNGHSDMKFLEARVFTTERICATLGVPKTIINYTDRVNIGNSDNQYKKFIENTIRPLERFLEQMFNTLFKDINPNVEFYILDEHINDLDTRSKIARDNVASGLWSRNEAREFIGSSFLEGDTEMDEYTVTGSVTSLTMALSSSTSSSQDPNLNPNNIPA